MSLGQPLIPRQTWAFGRRKRRRGMVVFCSSGALVLSRPGSTIPVSPAGSDCEDQDIEVRWMIAPSPGFNDRVHK